VIDGPIRTSPSAPAHPHLPIRTCPSAPAHPHLPHPQLAIALLFPAKFYSLEIDSSPHSIDRQLLGLVEPMGNRPFRSQK